jgi:hypothetical protein
VSSPAKHVAIIAVAVAVVGLATVVVVRRRVRRDDAALAAD